MTIELAAKFGRFVIVGAIATLAQYAVLVVWVEAFHLSATAGSGIGAMVGAVLSYVLNYHFTFRSSRPHRSAAWRFVAVATTGLMVNVLLMQLLNVHFGMHYLLAQLVATGVVLFWNFVGGALWSFVGPARPLRSTAEEPSR